MSHGSVPAAQRAYTHTKALILDGEAAAESMLSEGEIAQALGISRTPVREAFTRLQSEGWLRLYPRRGALVVPSDPGQARDLVEARLILETSCLQKLQDPQVRTDLVTELTAVLDDQRAALDRDDATGFAEQDLRFHRGIVAAAGNSVLTSFQDLIADKERRMATRSLWRSPEASRTVVRQHEQLLRAVGQGDAEAFRAALRHHLEGIHEGLLP